MDVNEELKFSKEFIFFFLGGGRVGGVKGVGGSG